MRGTMKEPTENTDTANENGKVFDPNGEYEFREIEPYFLKASQGIKVRCFVLSHTIGANGTFSDVILLRVEGMTLAPELPCIARIRNTHGLNLVRLEHRLLNVHWIEKVTTKGGRTFWETRVSKAKLPDSHIQSFIELADELGWVETPSEAEAEEATDAIE